MKVTVIPAKLSGRIAAIPSKSYAHRFLICAALSDGCCEIGADRTSADIEATARCLRALGADISRRGGVYAVNPADGERPVRLPELDCGESGSTLRFLAPIASALGGGTFTMSGRLAKRPMEPLNAALCAHRMTVEKSGNTVTYSGKLTGGEFLIPGDVSSQYISGLLMALPLCGGGEVRLTSPLASAPYVDITVDAMRAFGVSVGRGEGRFTVAPGQRYRRCDPFVPGDWSNAAFWLLSGAAVTGLDRTDAQGDKAILDRLADMGAKAVFTSDGACYIDGLDRIHGCEIDAGDIPDAVPALSVAAARAKGETRIFNSARLRAKESDRIATVCAMLTAFGVQNRATDDGIVITGRDGALLSCTVDAANDHRIAMAAAVGASFADGPVCITGAEAVNKSYPDFWDDYKKLGGQIDVEHAGQ